MEAREYNYKEEMKIFEGKIRREYLGADRKNAKHQFYWAFDKWRMLTLIQKIHDQARDGREISGAVVNEAVTNLLRRQKQDLLEEIEELKIDLEKQTELTKKAEADSLRNERTYHLMKDKKDMLLKELDKTQKERILLETDKSGLLNEIKSTNDALESANKRIKLYQRSTEEQKTNLDKAILLIQEKNEQLNELNTEY